MVASAGTRLPRGPVTLVPARPVLCSRPRPTGAAANAIALAVIAVLAVVYWYGKCHQGRQHPPGSQP